LTHVHVRNHRGVLAVSGVMIAALALSACGGSDDDSGAGTPSGGASTGSDSSALGAANAASGPAVQIGFVNEGVTPDIDTSNEEDAAKAVVSYANDYLGARSS
jgi:hypothetical protein